MVDEQRASPRHRAGEYRETLRKVRYTVSDLTGDDKAAAAELAALVRKLVAPESWQGRQRPGTIEPDGGALVGDADRRRCIGKWSISARSFATPGKNRSAAATIRNVSPWPRISIAPGNCSIGR